MNQGLKVLAFFISCIAASGQFAYGQGSVRFQELPGPAVQANGQTLGQAWAGGFNSPQFSAIDLNQDGQLDLFVFDRSSQRVTTFLAVQTNGQWQYQHAPQYESVFPADLRIFALLRDYNRDGKPDLFTASNLGIKVYLNTTNPGGIPSFDVAYSTLYYNTDINLQVGVEDLPAIADMDADGDLDILMWAWSGSTKLEYFQNQQADLNLPTSEMRLTKTDSWWGQVTRCVGACNQYRFNAECPSAHHIGGSSVLPLDLNADGVLDLVVGHDDCPDLVSLYNTGTNLFPKITSAAINLPPDITGSQFSVFPAAYYVDVTFDGVPDLVVAPNMTSNSHQNVDLTTSTWVYANTGTAAQPRFSGAKQASLQNQMIDVGEGAAPALGNLLGDASPDLLVGNTAVLRAGKYAASFALYQHKENGLELVDEDFLGLTAQNLQRLKPQLLDINGDGALDLAYSAYNPSAARVNFKYLLNQAPAGQAAQFSVASAVAVAGVLFFSGDTPYLYDVDQDGALDLLVGKSSGALQYHRNTATSTTPVWNLVSESLGGIAADASRRRLQILVHDVNADGKPDLLTSDDEGQLRVYPDIRAHLSATFQQEANILWQPLKEQYGGVNLGQGMGLAAADVNLNGRQDLLIGTHAGGLRFLEVTMGPLSVPDAEQENTRIQLYPNPTKGYTQLVTETPSMFTLMSVTGLQMAQGKTKAQELYFLNTQSLPPGLYLLRVTEANGRTATLKLVVQR